MPRTDAATPAVIVLFGAGVRPDGTPSATLARRIEAARRFGEALPVPPIYLPSGGIGRHGPSEASVMGERLRQGGVAPDRIVLDEVAGDTLQTVFNARAMLRRSGHLRRGGRVFAATSAYHLPRCLLLLRLAGMPALAVPPPTQPASHHLLQRWRWRLREVPAIPWDTLLLLAHETIDRFLTKR